MLVERSLLYEQVNVWLPRVLANFVWGRDAHHHTPLCRVDRCQGLFVQRVIVIPSLPCDIGR